MRFYTAGGGSLRGRASQPGVIFHTNKDTILPGSDREGCQGGVGEGVGRTQWQRGSRAPFHSSVVAGRGGLRVRVPVSHYQGPVFLSGGDQ